ncbi:MAG: TlpA family protein disulfide reductase [Planctomycetes bacterium]|nr:TlpA family protein disulfide reductase [Planctomycetota bacterium]
MRRLAHLTAITLIGAVLGTLSATAETPRIDRAPAAPFRARALTGETLDLGGLRARGPVVLDFWATWCQPCTQSLPEMEGVYRRLKERGVTVIGVSVDGPRNQARVHPFASKLGLSFPILFDAGGSLQRDYQVRAIPTTIVIDSAGAIVYAGEGWFPGETRKVEAILESLLAPASGSPQP